MNGADLKAARERLGLSVYELGAALRLKGGREAQGQYVREMESGRRSLSGPIAVAVEGFEHGARPAGFHVERTCDSEMSEDGSSCGQRVPCTGRVLADGRTVGGCGEPCSWMMRKAGHGVPPWGPNDRNSG